MKTEDMMMVVEVVVDRYGVGNKFVVEVLHIRTLRSVQYCVTYDWPTEGVMEVVWSYFASKNISHLNFTPPPPLFQASHPHQVSNSTTNKLFCPSNFGNYVCIYLILIINTFLNSE